MRRQAYYVIIITLVLLMVSSSVWASDKAKENLNGYKLIEPNNMPSYFRNMVINAPYIFTTWDDDLHVYSKPDTNSPEIPKADLEKQHFLFRGIYERVINGREYFLFKMINEQTGQIVWYRAGLSCIIAADEYADPKGYTLLTAAQLPTEKQKWPNSTAIFTKEKVDDYLRQTLRNPVQYHPNSYTRVNLDTVLNKTFKIVGCYKSNRAYNWKLVNDDGDILWYIDEGYNNDRHKPFYLAQELANYQNKNLYLQKLIGKPLWVNKNSLYEDSVSHLELVLIRDIVLDASQTKITVTLEKNNGTTFTWNASEIESELIVTNHTYAFVPNFFNFSPYDAHPDWSDDTWLAIKAQKVKVGWNDDKCILSLGFPSRVNRTTGSWGITEQWVYENSRKYLYFTNGVLDSIQD